MSQPFLASEFIDTVELPGIRTRAYQGKLLVVPILVEPSNWEENDFLSARTMMPGKPTPLIDYTESEKDLANVRFEILRGRGTVRQRLKSAISRPPNLAGS